MPPRFQVEEGADCLRIGNALWDERRHAGAGDIGVLTILLIKSDFRLPLSFQQALPSKGWRLVLVAQLGRSLVRRVAASLKEFFRRLQERIKDWFVTEIFLRPPNVRNKHPPGAHSLPLALASFHQIIATAVEIIQVPGCLPPFLRFQSFT